MNLSVKKELAARTLKVGKDRVIFNTARLDEIKEAITRQDIKDLVEAKAITIAEIKGSRTKPKRKTRRREGSIKKKVNTRKRDYMTMTRKLRKYISWLKERKSIDREQYLKLRKEIRAKNFKSQAQMKERVLSMTGGKK